MKPLIVYYSRTQNTIKIAEAMAESLEADLLTTDRIKEEDLKGRKLIGIGSGIYMMKHDKSVFEVANKIPKSCKAFIFSTSGFKSKLITNIEQLSLKRKLKKRGIETIGQWNCPGHDKSFPIIYINLSKGRPNQQDIENAKEFAYKMEKKSNRSN
jgi:flavodoxin